ncbi:MAG: hypothetical protein CMB97_00520 [Flavobacteriaceae bacterium]|nr:hypothetical protein [Flavobacteriaceae bacterium]
MKTKGPLEYVFRFMSGLTARILKNTFIRPNHITMIRIPIMFFILYQYMSGSYLNIVLASIGLFVWDWFDCLDGDLAVLQSTQSNKGIFLETISDRLLGRLAGPLGFVLALRCYFLLNNIWIIVVFFIYVLMDSFHNYILFLKNQRLKLDSIIKKDESEKEENTKNKLLKRFRDLVLYYELQHASLLVLILYPFINGIALMVPIVFYLAVYTAINIVLLIIIWKQMSQIKSF